MAKKSDSNSSTVTEVKTDTETSLPVLKVEHPGADADASFLREQDEALLRYKQTGERGIYIDPTRDQEPDIAPELGLSPHPELANPRAPEMDFGGGVNLDAKSNPVLQDVETKVERGEEVAKANEEALKAAEESRPETDESGAPVPVETPATSGRTETPTTAVGDPRAQESSRVNEGRDESTSTKPTP